MLRIAIPYGQLSAAQLRKLAEISRRYDRSFGHFTTRQNMQLNWPKFEETPEILGELASVEIHAIQTSGNCIRNITTDKFAGVAPDELTDPCPWCEVLRQWSTFHPEFAFLPRKHLLSYLDALLRVYNRHGRRDNLYKARIKILVNALGIEEFARQV